MVNVFIFLQCFPNVKSNPPSLVDQVSILATMLLSLPDERHDNPWKVNQTGDAVCEWVHRTEVQRGHVKCETWSNLCRCDSFVKIKVQSCAG